MAVMVMFAFKINEVSYQLIGASNDALKSHLHGLKPCFICTLQAELAIFDMESAWLRAPVKNWFIGKLET